MSKDNIKRIRIEDLNVNLKDKDNSILIRDELKALLKKYDIEEYLVSLKFSNTTASLMAECYDEYITSIVLNLLETNPEAVKAALIKYIHSNMEALKQAFEETKH